MWRNSPLIWPSSSANKSASYSPAAAEDNFRRRFFYFAFKQALILVAAFCRLTTSFVRSLLWVGWRAKIILAT
jgi:hypothetical protein